MLFRSDWHNDDLAAEAGSAADGVLVPKVETGQQVQALADTLDTLGAPKSLQLWVMMVTPRPKSSKPTGVWP